VPTYVVRVWLPDRPGALGSVASRIGAVRGDLVAIDILERGAGRAIDELVVELPEDELVPLLVKEMNEVDGVDVEDVRMVAEAGRRDSRLAALETAADVIAQRSPLSVLESLTIGAAREFEVDWAAVADVDRGMVAAAAGDHPPEAWVLAFAGGVTANAATGDVAWAPMPSAGMTLVVGRPGRALRDVERKQLAALANIADIRWFEMARKVSLAIHPSAV
jgi:hypothetical protein